MPPLVTGRPRSYSLSRLLWLVAAIAAGFVFGLATTGFGALLHSYATYLGWVVTRPLDPTERWRTEVTNPNDFIRWVVLEAGRTWLMLLLLPFGIWQPKARRHGVRTGRAPILFVHGFTMNWSNFLLLRRRMRRAGLGPMYAANLRPDFARLEALADRLERRVDEVLAATGASTVDVVAHSMGGLVARHLMGRSPKIARLITLGTPHRGTRVARLALGPNGAQMREGSPFIEALNARALERVTSIFSTHDNVVFPCDNGRVGAPGTDIQVQGLGHFGYLTNRGVAERVIELLGVPDDKLAEGGSRVRPQSEVEA